VRIMGMPTPEKQRLSHAAVWAIVSVPWSMRTPSIPSLTASSIARVISIQWPGSRLELSRPGIPHGSMHSTSISLSAKKDDMLSCSAFEAEGSGPFLSPRNPLAMVPPVKMT
jgi:hypothetical protein